MSFQSSTDKGIIFDGLSDYLVKKEYQGVNINIEKNGQDTKLKINKKLENDTLVRELSDDVQSFLTSNHIVSSPDDIYDRVVIGPSVWSYMQNTAIQALIFWIIAMSIYMIFSFGTIRKFIAPWILVFVVVATTVLDVSIPLWAYGLWMSLDPTIQIDSIFIIAILTIIGYGINDVIIIFDRIRENLWKWSGVKKINYLKVFEDSIRQSMKRSIGTSFSTLLVLIAMVVFGTGVIQRFAFTVGIGVITAFFSSIFIGVPLAYLFIGKKDKN